jgi:hypothetical protein
VNLIEAIVQIIDMLLFWRVILSLLIGMGIGFFFKTHATGEFLQWVAVVFFSILGLITGAVWQSKSNRQ